MNGLEKHELVEILEGPPFHVRLKLKEYLEKVVVEDDGKTMEQHRTDQQNKALHVWFEAVAEECRKNSVDAQMVMTKVVRMNMTATFIKEMWKSLQLALFQKKSTTQLRKSGEIDIIRDHFIRFFAEKFELELPPFPDSKKDDLQMRYIRNTTVPYPDNYEQPLI